jgi:hypothetical protein
MKNGMKSGQAISLPIMLTQESFMPHKVFEVFVLSSHCRTRRAQASDTACR